MANTFIKPSVIARQALANLYEMTIMLNLVHRDYEPEFAGTRGDTITIRRPPMFVAQEYSRGDGILVQDATESGISMSLNHFADVSFAVTTEDMTLNLDDFNEQLLMPAVEAIAQKVDRDILALRTDIVQEVGTTAGELYSHPNALIAAGRVLTQQKVPFTQRSAVVGPVIAAEWSKTDILQKADQRGDTIGLREASLGGRLMGFDPYLTNNITTPEQTSGNSTTEEGLAFHRTAFAVAFRTLALPRGAQQAAVQTYRGMSLRVVYDYDMDLKSDVVSIDCIYGTKTIDPNRAVLIKGADVA